MQVSNRVDDSSDETFAISEELVRSPSHKVASTTAIDFDGLLPTPLILHEDLANGCGGILWPAGVRLTKYLLRKKRDELGRCSSIIELGAGGGLVGLAVAVGCKPTGHVHLTDQEPMLDLMKRNIQANDLEGRARAAIYDWGSKTPAQLPSPPDVVLAADCVYFEPAFPLLRQTLHDVIGESTAIKKDFDVVEVDDDDPECNVYVRQNIFLYTIKRRTIANKYEKTR